MKSKRQIIGLILSCFFSQGYAQFDTIQWNGKDIKTTVPMYPAKATFKIANVSQDSLIFTDSKQNLYGAVKDGSNTATILVEGNPMMESDTEKKLYLKDYCYRLSKYRGSKGTVSIPKNSTI